MSFGASVLRVPADVMVLVSCAGTTAVKGEAFTPVAATAPPMRTANLPAMPLRNCFLSFCIQAPLIPQNPDSTNFTPRFDSNRQIIFARFDALKDEGIQGILAGIDGHKGMIRNNLQPPRVSA
jgi:hypothetical protein